MEYKEFDIEASRKSNQKDMNERYKNLEFNENGIVIKTDDLLENISDTYWLMKDFVTLLKNLDEDLGYLKDAYKTDRK